MTDQRCEHTTADLWWNDRWAWRGALACAPLGALFAILYALAVLRLGVVDALWAYLLGAAVASGIGCLLGGLLGGAANGWRHRRCDDADAAAADDAEPVAAGAPGRHRARSTAGSAA